MLAPNGRKSNLNADQYYLVRTLKFKEWFGDWENDPANASKVVDENGEPLVVYHGTNSKSINIFDRTQGGYYKSKKMGIDAIGIWFSDNKEYAKKIGNNVYEVFLSLKRPKEYFIDYNKSKKIIEVSNDNFISDEEKMAQKDYDSIKTLDKDLFIFLTDDEILKNYKISKENLPKFKKESKDKIKLIENKLQKSKELTEKIKTENEKELLKKDTLKQFFNFSKDCCSEGGIKAINTEKVRNEIMSKTFSDGVLLYNTIGDSSLLEDAVPINIYVAFEPNQIKLSDGTNTTFDSSNPDIRYAEGGETGQQIVCVNCGWGWNTNDSEDYDKYICHNCGFDNRTYYDADPIGFKDGGEVGYVGNEYLEKKYGHLKKKNAKFEDLPEIYIRIGLPKKVRNKYLPSRNHLLGILEDGVSVFTARYSPNSKFVFVDLHSDSERSFLWETYGSFKTEMKNGSKNKMYLLEGNPLLSGGGSYQLGADYERLLDINGLKVIGDLNPKKIIEYDKGTPSRKNKSIILFDTETFSGKELKSYPKFKDGGEVDDKKKTYEKWKSLVNMSYSELEKFYNSEDGKKAGLSSSEAKKQGIDSGRESARMILKMKSTPNSKWTDTMWKWAKKQISFISRMSGMKGDLYDDKGNKTRKHTSLLIWGHNPKKYNAGGLIAPNGKKSNLTPEQYKLVRTPEFKEWFGDWENDPESASKILNQNGEPLICFHGTNQDFSIFNEKYVGMANDRGFYGRGFYFTFQTESENINFAINEAIYYGKKLLNCFIKSINPFNFSLLSKYKGYDINYVGSESIVFLANLVKYFPSLADKITIEKKVYNSNINEYNIKQVSINIIPQLIEKYSKELTTFITDNNWGERNIKSGYVKKEIVEYDDTSKGGKKGFYESIDQLGRIEFRIKDGIQYPSDEEIEILLICDAIEKYDGIKSEYHPEGYMTRYKEITDAIRENHDCILQGETGDELVVFESNQIKLADGTNTTFDGNNPDIRYDYGGELEKLGITQEQRENWREEHKVNQKQKQNPNVLEYAKQLQKGEISQDDYLKKVKEYLPIRPFKEVPQIPTLLQIVSALDKNKVEKGIIGFTKFIEDGEYVASRLDIPAYEGYDIWVVSVHNGNKEGNVIGYGQTAYLKDITFLTSPKVALNIATNRSDKTTFARMKGSWINKHPQEVREMAVKYMNDKNWVQVGMNPYRHSWFYDKSDGMPLLSAEEVIQVGALVLAKNPVKTTPDNEAFIVNKDKPNIKFKDGGLFKSHKSIEQIAKEKNVPLVYAKNQLKKGMKTESEHSNSKKVQKTIALQHLDEMMNYYTKLKTIEKK